METLNDFQCLPLSTPTSRTITSSNLCSKAILHFIRKILKIPCSAIWDFCCLSLWMPPSSAVFWEQDILVSHGSDSSFDALLSIPVPFHLWFWVTGVLSWNPMKWQQDYIIMGDGDCMKTKKMTCLDFQVLCLGHHFGTFSCKLLTKMITISIWCPDLSYPSMLIYIWISSVSL
jgi:hypothetical protein